MQPGEGDALLKINIADKAGTNYDLIIKGGDKNILESPDGVQPQMSGGARKFGDFDPHHGNIEVTNWLRGWGGYDLRDDEERYEFAKNVWTATSNRAFNTILGVHAIGQENYYMNNFAQQDRHTSPLKIAGQQTGHYSHPFTTASATNVKFAYLWVYYDGDRTISDVSFQCQVWDDSAGDPGSSLGSSNTVTLTEADMGHWHLVQFTFSSAVSLSASTAYHLVFYCDAGTGGNMTNILLSTGASGPGEKSIDGGTTWGLALSINCAFTPARHKVRQVRFVELQKTIFKLILYKSGTNELWMSGDHGKATSATASTIVDTGMGVTTSWTTNQWAGSVIIIVAGTGVGQERIISSNTNAGSITVDENWDTTPDTTSEYAIVNFDNWYEIPSGTHGLSNSKSVVESGNVLQFAKGYGTAMRRMRFNGSAVQFADDGSNDADIVFDDGVRLWKMTDDDGVISYATYVAWGSNHTFTAITNKTPVGSNYTGANLHGGNIYFFKEDGIWFMNANDTTLYPHPTNMSFFYNKNNGRYSCPGDEFLLFSWGPNVQRLAGFTVENLNPNRDRGMDNDYRGAIGGLVPHPAGLFFAVNGDNDNVSSVNIYDGISFHPAWTGQIPRIPITDLAWFNSELSRPTLLIAYGEGIVYQRYPKNTTNPLQDGGVSYETVGELTTAVIDMSNKSIPKMFKDLVVFSEGVLNIPPSYYGEIVVQYKKDDGDWTYLTSVSNVTRGLDETSFTDPDLSTINALSNINELQLRFHFITSGPQITSLMYAHTLKCFARTPIKSVYSIPIDVSAVTERLGSGAPATMMDQFWTWAMSAEALLMTSQHPRLHNKTVIIIPRSIRTNYIDRANETFAVDFFLELREV